MVEDAVDKEARFRGENMKQFVPFIALIFGACAGSQSLARSAKTKPELRPTQPTNSATPTTSATPATPPITTSDTTQNLVGKPFGGWVIPQKYWMNTPEPIWLGGLRGDVTVVEFFRINCSHCKDAAPARRALYQKYRKQGLKMIGFHSPGIIGDLTDDENKWDKVRIQVKKWGLTYPIAFDEDRVFFDKNQFRFYPTVLVLDEKGIVRFQQTGYSPEKAKELDAFVGQSLKQK